MTTPIQDAQPGRDKGCDKSPAAELDALIAFATSLTYEDLPSHVVDRTKDLLVDHIGVSLRGIDTPWSRIVLNRVLAEGGAAEATVYGGAKVPARNAALANGASAHALELDDTHAPSFSHTGAVVFPAALGAAQSENRDGKEYLASCVIGVEVMARIGTRAGAALLARGFHPTSANGVFGATAAAGRIFGLCPSRLRNAFGIAASMASGLMQFSLETEGTMVKRLHAGLPASNGVFAAQLARDGLSGPHAAIDGDLGFLRAFAGHHNVEDVASGLGKVFAVEEVAIKSNACCLHFAALIDALAECLARAPRPISDLDSIEIMGPDVLLKGHLEYRPRSVMAAQYSLPYVVAAAIMLDPRSPDSFSENAFQRPDLLAMAARVVATHDPELQARCSGKFGARVRLGYRDGTAAECEVIDAQGSPARPLKRTDIEAKFRVLTAPALTPGAQDDLLEAIMGVDRAQGLPRLGHLLGRTS